MTPDAVRARFEQLFVLARSRPRGFVWSDPRFDGDFDGSNSFVVHSPFSIANRGWFRPVIDGYFVPGPSGGTDIFIRSAYPGFVWLLELGAFLVGTAGLAITAARLSDIVLTIPAVAALAFFTIGAVVLDGSSFTRRVCILLT